MAQKRPASILKQMYGSLFAECQRLQCLRFAQHFAFCFAHAFEVTPSIELVDLFAAIRCRKMLLFLEYQNKVV